MIVYDLACDYGHRFEGWFGSSADFAKQQEAGLVSCPQCGTDAVSKAPMAPAVGKKGNQQIVATPSPEVRAEASPETRPVSNAPLPPEVAKAMEKLAQAQKKALKDSKWVGRDFADQSRAMHYGEQDHEAIHGEASLQDAKDLLDEGVSIAPLPFPVAPPDELN